MSLSKSKNWVVEYQSRYCSLSHYDQLLIINRSWILTKQEGTIFQKQILENKEIVLEIGVRNIQLIMACKLYVHKVCKLSGCTHIFVRYHVREQDFVYDFLQNMFVNVQNCYCTFTSTCAEKCLWCVRIYSNLYMTIKSLKRIS